MADLVDPKVTITPPEKEDIGETDANADVEISYELPDGELESFDNRDSRGVGTVKQVIYTSGSPELEIVYNPDGGGGHFTGLKKADRDTISVIAYVNYIKTEITWEYSWEIVGYDEWCEPDTTVTNPDGSTTTIPGKCHQDEIYDAVLTGGNYEDPEVTNITQKIVSNTVTVYTRPGECIVFTSKDSNGNPLLYSGGTIYITASMVNNWCEKCG